MAAADTGGDGNGGPTTPDHGGAAAEGRQDLGKLLERLGREIGDRSGENTTPERRGMVGLTGDREVVAAQRGSDGSGGGGRLEIAGERRRRGSAWRAR
ncbi:hypothetical protein [Oryza sativa Japonica Group]|nr:hypothetical protein [Oryza sativa Japonica Group]BAD82249.1 hypothetical protein [Oryza sativa Japonica Group]